MTTIAYRDGIMASDTLVTSGSNCVGEIQKSGRTADGYLWAVAGSACLIADFRDWAEHRKGDPYEIKDRDGNFILITPQGKVREWWGDGWCESEAEFYAWGSGDSVALGAMAVGASAVEAVAAASRIDKSTGGKMMTVSCID